MLDLQTKKIQTSDGKSSLVIVSHLGGIPGGVSLDMSLASSLSVVRAGHVILAKDGKYYAAPVSGSAYAAFGDKKPVGVLASDVVPASSLAAVMTIGQVRASASPYTVTDEIKTALPRIEFL